MNIQNIEDLTNQLQKLGFGDLSQLLAKRICFNLPQFTLPFQVKKGEHTLNFQLLFEMTDSSNGYSLVFYEAVFHDENVLAQTINGVNTALLLQQMAEVNWRDAFDFTLQSTQATGDKFFKKELQIRTIMDNLAALDRTNDGKNVAVYLKNAYWAGTAYRDVFGNLPTIKSRADVTQRFYFLDNQPGISVDEAYRYLHNRWLEREMLARRKQANNSKGHIADSPEATGSRTLRKRRRKVKPFKSENREV